MVKYFIKEYLQFNNKTFEIGEIVEVEYRQVEYKSSIDRVLDLFTGDSINDSISVKGKLLNVDLSNGKVYKIKLDSSDQYDSKYIHILTDEIINIIKLEE